MKRLSQHVRESLGRRPSQPSAAEENSGTNKDEEARTGVRARAASMLEPWVGEPGVSDQEREQRKGAAREIERALLLKIRFASDQEEMAWLKEKAEEAGPGRLRGFEKWLLDQNLDTPSKMWRVVTNFNFRFLWRLGPSMFLAKMALLTSLPDRMRVDGDLNLHGCTGLTSLPSGLHVEGGLYLRGCTGLMSLPDDLHIGGRHLYLRSCTGLTSLPSSLHVSGRLTLIDCTGLTSLPDGMHVGDCLTLTKCTGLTSLPDGLHVGGSLELEACTGLTSLPDGLDFNGDLSLTSCTGLTSLPDGLRVGGNLDIRSCTGLTSLPTDMNVEGALILMDCTGLTSLPDGLYVDGDLNLQGCTGLTSLPSGLHVDRGLHLRGCTGLTSLPDGMHVSGYLDLMACTGLTSLPDSVLEWGMCSNGKPRHIDLTGAGLPPEELARLQTLGNPALHFKVSRRESFGGAGLGADDFLTLDDAATFWTKEAGFPSELVISQFVEAAYVRGVLGFLSNLRRAKEFNNSLAKEGLASRVVQVLELVTGEDNGVREELMVRMADAVDTCSDKPMWALNQMSVLVHVAEARGDREALRALGMGVMRLEVVHHHVRKAMDAMNFVDDVCVYLRFELALRESLKLPIPTLWMMYPSYMTFTDESIDAANDEALGVTEADLENWLPNWSEWQRQDRVEFAEGLDFSALKRSSVTKRLSLSLGNLRGNEVADPVRLKPLATVWSLQDLLKHWINTSMDLDNTPRDVDYMRLNLSKCI